MKISGNIVDVLNERIYSGVIEVSEGKIKSITEDNNKYDHYIIPGFIDSHIHIESSMLAPSEFSRAALQHGTIAVVADPHEIANVLGVNGVKFMIEDAERSALKFYFSAPSCVPATKFETAGATIGPKEIEALFQEYPQIRHLGEMMNVPGVLNSDPDIKNKLDIAKKYNKQIDGHAPGMKKTELKKYMNAGISTDHESISKEEALKKLDLGMNVQIREGSAAQNFNELILAGAMYPDKTMLCTDDLHPDDLVNGHINILIKRGLEFGINIIKLLRMASVNPIKHYNLDIGLLQKDDPADFLLVNSLKDLNVQRSYINGKCVYRKSIPISFKKKVETPNIFKCHEKEIFDFHVEDPYKELPVIQVHDKQLYTSRSQKLIKKDRHNLISDTERDILKIAVINRYENKTPAVAFIHGFGLKSGAIASSVAHDSHNIVCVGVKEEDMRDAVNLIIKSKGGISIVSENEGISELLPLPIAGLMSNKNYKWVAETYANLDKLAKDLGSPLSAPFMTLSFMSLLVIPEIKLSDKGLFDGNNFSFIK